MPLFSQGAVALCPGTFSPMRNLTIDGTQRVNPVILRVQPFKIKYLTRVLCQYSKIARNPLCQGKIVLSK